MPRRLLLPALALAILAYSSPQGIAQTPTSLSAELTRLIDLIPAELTSSRETVSQRASIDPERDYVLIVERTEGEGRRLQTERAEINLPFVLRARLGRASGDRLPVTLQAQPAGIATADDAGKVTYEDAFDILTASVEQARQIEAQITLLLPLARAAYDRQSALPNDLPGLEAFLARSVTTVSAGQEDLVQTLTFQADGTATYTRSGAANREVTTATQFVVADLQPLASKVEARSGYLELQLETRKGREYVERVEDGRRRYQGDVTLRFADVATAQLAREAFAKTIPLAEERSKRASTALTSVAQAAAQLSAALTATPTAESSQVFAISGCRATATREEAGRVNVREESIFDFSDIDPRKVEVSARGSELQLSLHTRADERLVRRVKNDLPDGYSQTLALTIAGPATAAEARAAAAYLADNCKRDTTPVSFSAALGLANVDRFPTGEDEQALAPAGSSDCTYALTRTERNGSRSEETVFTFNLGDLDVRAARLKVSGDEVSLVYGTNRGEKVVEEVEADGDRSFEDEVELRFATVDDARVFRAATERAVANCKR